jgi:hypothetical protein
MASPIALLLVPRTVDGFILYDQGQDLLRSPGVVAVEAPRVPHGALGRLPAGIGRAVARAQARRVKVSGEPAALMIFHPFQLPFAQALLHRWPDCELWYGLFDRTPAAPDAQGRTRERLEALHREAAERADLVFAVSPKLAELEREAGRDAIVVPSAADSFPAPDPQAAVVVACLGNLGARTDWSLLRDVAQRMPELTLLMIGEVAEAQVRGNADYAACRELPGFVWLGRRSDEEAARLIGLADAGIAPFTRTDFNDAGLPNRILKAARQGRTTIAPDLAGVRVWDDAVIRCADTDAWVQALHAVRSTRPDMTLRDWALRQTAEHQNAPLWTRLRELGVAGPR